MVERCINWTDGCLLFPRMFTKTKHKRPVNTFEMWKMIVDLHLWYALNCSRNRCCSTLSLSSLANCRENIWLMCRFLFKVPSCVCDRLYSLKVIQIHCYLLQIRLMCINLSDFQNTPTWAWKGKWIFSISPIELVFLLFVTLATGC